MIMQSNLRVLLAFLIFFYSSKHQTCHVYWLYWHLEILCFSVYIFKLSFRDFFFLFVQKKVLYLALKIMLL